MTIGSLLSIYIYAKNKSWTKRTQDNKDSNTTGLICQCQSMGFCTQNLWRWGLIPHFCSCKNFTSPLPLTHLLKKYSKVSTVPQKERRIKSDERKEAIVDVLAGEWEQYPTTKKRVEVLTSQINIWLASSLVEYSTPTVKKFVFRGMYRNPFC